MKIGKLISQSGRIAALTLVATAIGSLAFLASTMPAGGQTNAVTKSLTLDTNGVVSKPANFWTTNAAGIASALGLGSAATNSTADFATAAQGQTADDLVSGDQSAAYASEAGYSIASSYAVESGYANAIPDTISGDKSFTGAVTLGDAVGDPVTVNGLPSAPNNTPANISANVLMTSAQHKWQRLANQVRLQIFQFPRVNGTRGGTGSTTAINNAITTWSDNGANYNTVLTALDATSWAQWDLGGGFINTLSGSGGEWSFPFSIGLRLGASRIEAGTPARTFFGVSGQWTNGWPTLHGTGICMEAGALKMWAHSGVTYAASGDDSTDIITANGHPFVNGDIIRFTALAGGSGLAVGTSYFVVGVSGSTFQLAASLGGAALNLGSNITTATIPALPTYSSAISGIAATTDTQVIRNVLIVSNGAGTAKLYYSENATEIAPTAVKTISVPSSGSANFLIKLSFASLGLWSYGITGDAGTDVLTATGLPFTLENGNIVRFWSITGGTGLATGTSYYVVNVSGSTFQLSLTSGGAAIDFSSNITAGQLGLGTTAPYAKGAVMSAFFAPYAAQ